MNIPKTSEELQDYCIAVQFSATESKPFQPNGDSGAFVSQYSVSSKGPFVDLIYGEPKYANFGATFSLKIRLADGSTKKFGFYRIAKSNEWIFDQATSKYLGVTYCGKEIDNFINWAFLQFFSQVEGAGVPTLFKSGIEIRTSTPDLKKTDFYAEAQKASREEQEREEAAEERERREAEERERREAEELERREAEEQLTAKRQNVKSWFMTTLINSLFDQNKKFNEQMGEKLSDADISALGGHIEDSDIGLELIGKWYSEFQNAQKYNF
tara:strand:+ start:2458 stop:3264 length:807 start_codon:yes stop_codon:yes gene_type:complete